MGYLSCRAESSLSTCRSISAVAASSQSQSRNKKQQQQQQQRSQPSPSPQEEEDEEEKEKNEVKHIHHFTYAELESATDSFSESSLLGRGSHGSVYKATVISRNHPIVVAVKRPSPRPPPLTAAAAASTSRNEVENEIEILSHIRSPRLVNLIGFSSSSNINKPHGHRERLLVIEFMPNGTLYDFIHNNPRPPNWPRRLRLALQTAKALLTLHSARPPVIHRDVKSANILIDRNFNARLADFGLALRLIDDDPALPSSCRSTPPAGTLGYLDPSYVTPDNLSPKTDVFSFGILLLELMSGRKAIDVANSPPSVVEWAVPLLRKGKVRAIYDPRISPPRDSRIRRQLALLAASCVRSSDERRPLMEEVVKQLKLLSESMSTTVAKPWDGLLVVNPCSMVDTGSNLSKTSTKKVKGCSSKSLSPNANVKLVEEMGVRREDEIPVDGSNKPPPLAVNSVRPLRDEQKKVLLDGEAKWGSKNLMELLSRPDGEILEFCGGHSSTVVNRARALRLSSGYHDRCQSMRIGGHQTVKGAQLEQPARLDGLINLNGNIRSTIRDII